jgi:hypothetical protein
MSSFNRKKQLELPKKKRFEHIINNEPINYTLFKNLNISVCIQCANLDIFKELLTYIINFESFEWNRLQIIVNCNIDLVNYDTMSKLIKNTFNNNNTHIIIIKSKNVGLDIGGFLRCSEYIKEDDHIIAKIHTKGRKEWRRGLMKIYTKKGIYNSIKLLHYDKIGMVGNNNQLWDFYKNINMSYRNNINKLCNIMQLNFSDSKLHNSFLIGGTIFMCKKNIIESIIKHRNILYQYCNGKDNYYKNPNAFYFELTMERLFGYIVYHHNKHIVGLIS